MVNTASSLSQGQQFQQMTAKFHGGRKKNNKSKMVKTRRGNIMRGGSMFTPYSDYPTAFNQNLPTDIRELARIAPLDAKFAELPAIERAAGVPQSGGKSPINSPTMLLSSPAEEAAARLNPQWYTENTVIPNFRGPLPVPGSQPVPAPPAKGGKRSKVKRNNRKTKRARAVKNQMKQSRSSRSSRSSKKSSNKERVRLLAEELKAAKNNGERNHNACFPKLS